MANYRWNAKTRLEELRAIHLHAPDCTWPLGPPCVKFSTDGTRLGAEIAHTMGTTDEGAIAKGQAPNDNGPEPFVSDIDAEQADWDSDEDREEGGVGLAARRGEPGPHPHHDEEQIKEYRLGGLDWN